jgi:hypothetical protein
MKTVIVEVTEDQLPALDRVLAKYQHLKRWPVHPNAALTTNTGSEARWRGEIPESESVQHPEWQIVSG